MSLEKRSISDDKIPIYDEAVVYRRREYWQTRMWLTQERKYARVSLKTGNIETAVDKAKKHYHELRLLDEAAPLLSELPVRDTAYRTLVARV